MTKLLDQQSLSRRRCLKVGAAALAGTALTGHAGEAPQPMTDFFEICKKRRSVRKYKSDPVPDEHIRQIIGAANMAPTAGNRQPWKFVVVRDAEKIKQFKTETINVIKQKMAENNLTDPDKQKEILQNVEKGVDNYLTAPVYIVLLVEKDEKYPAYVRTDGTLAAAALMLAARALGYGSVYLTDGIPEEASKKVLNIPDKYERICMTPIGIPDSWPETPKKKSVDEVICYETIS